QGAGGASRPRYQEGLEESAEAHRHQGEESLGSTGCETEQAQNGQCPPAACKPSTCHAFLAQAGEARGVVTVLNGLARIRKDEARAEPESLIARRCPCSPGIMSIQVDSISSVLEHRCNPGRLFGVQSRYDLGFAVIDLTSVRSRVIAAVEHNLKIERDRRITGQKGDLNRRQWFLEVHWVDVKRFNVVEGMNRDVIVERSTSGQSRLKWNRRRMVALPKQVDLDEVDLARQPLPLLS